MPVELRSLLTDLRFEPMDIRVQTANLSDNGFHFDALDLVEGRLCERRLQPALACIRLFLAGQAVRVREREQLIDERRALLDQLVSGLAQMMQLHPNFLFHPRLRQQVFR